MNKTNKEAKEFASCASSLVALANKKNIDIGVAPTFTSLASVKEEAPSLTVAAQNCHYEDHGAFTGEISIPMLLELGVKMVIIGHSERRTYFGETNEACNLKIKALLANDMSAIYCCGETLEQFENEKTKEVIKEQIEKGLEGLDASKIKDVIVAYEPIWSIGTGKNASKEIAQDICSYIRSLLNAMYGKVSEEMRILYGGSVKPENIHDYLKEEDVDGALVGGASLKVDSFEKLIENIGD